MKGFFKTVAVITVFSVCEKFLGFLYRIFLSRSIGAEGVGLYQVALSVFSLLLTACCSGIPITVSRLMTKYRAQNQKDKISKVITAGLAFTLMTTLPVCIIFFALKNHLGILFADDRCINIFLVILPGLVFTSLYSVFRGVFWGNKDFLPYSIIELLEEAVMIIVGIILITGCSGVYEGAYYAGLAVLISFLFSFTLSTIIFFVKKNKLKNPKTEFKPLLSSAMPITVMRTANSLIISLVSIILPLRLMAIGMSSSSAMHAYGSAVGEAIPILFIPSTLIGSFTIVLIPCLAENYYKKEYDKLKTDIEKALKFTVLITAFFVPLFLVCGEEIGVAVFNNAESGKYLSVSSFLMLFMGVSNITTSMLNSIGMEKKTLLYFIISSVFMLLSVWFLPSVFGVYSLLIGFTFIYGLTSVLNLILLNKQCRKKPVYIKFFLRTVLLLVPTIIFGFLLKGLLLPVLGTVLTLLIVSMLLITFNGLLYIGFGVVRVEMVFSQIKTFVAKRRLKKET